MRGTLSLGALRWHTFDGICVGPQAFGPPVGTLLSVYAVCPPRCGLLEAHFCRQVRCVRPVGGFWKLTFVDRCGVSAPLGPSGSSLLSTGAVCPPRWGLLEVHFCRQVRCVRHVGASWKLTFVDRCGVSATLGPPGNSLLTVFAWDAEPWGPPLAHFLCQNSFFGSPKRDFRRGCLLKALFVTSKS